MQSRVTPIAVIGMGCRLPGGIDSPDAFWRALLRGDDLVTEIPPDRWDVEDHYDPERGVPDRSVSRWGGFIDDVGGFDAAFFGFGEREATAIDPQHRLLLETSWEAIEHAGIVPASMSGSRTGVFIGLCQQDYTLMTGDAGVLGDAYGYTCTPFSMASGRIAYGLGLQGPAITMDTSCSSGLLAVHLACRSLDSGESDLALAGGAMLVLDPRVSTSASGQGMLSPTGRCHTFDVAADGFVRSDGCAVVMLKRLPDAERDGDRILAVVRGTAANQDGRSETITTPSRTAQATVYRAALEAAGVDPSTVGVVEAHGTGTPKGDPLEFASLAEVYGAAGNRVALGSAKSNVGHTEAAAGAVGLVKAVLELRHGLVPPMAHFTRLPDELARIDTGLFVPQEVTPWPDKGDARGPVPRRAGVTSFGMSGTNVHAVLEQAPDASGAPAERPAPGALVVPLSSTSAGELRRTAGRLADWLAAQECGVRPVDLAYTLARRRGHRTVRTAVVAGNSVDDLVDKLREIACSQTPYPPAAGHDDRGPVWIFSGQGSQWAAMGAELLANEPAFAATVARAEPLIAAESGFSVTEAMSAAETVTGIGRVQPTLFAFQVAMAEAMRCHGVRPGAVIGHSMGEIAAAVVAGALSLQDGVKVICRRSELMSRVAGAGAMATVELPARQVRDELATRGIADVVVSVIASPNSVVIGGAAHRVRDLVAGWEARDVMAREVAVDVASHSSQVDPILAELAERLADLAPSAPVVPCYSATLDDPRVAPTFDAGYWVNNLRGSVKFAAAVQAALDDGHRVFAEPSPHPLLTRAVEQTAAAADIVVQALAGLRREQPVPHGLLGFLGDLYSAGAAIDFAALYPAGRLVDAPLPTWTRQRLLVESDGSTGRGEPTVAVHPLLGAHVRLPEEPERHAWQGEIGTATLPWLADHRVNGVAVFPGAGFCEMALAGAAQIFGPDAEVRDVRFEQMLLLDDETPVSAVASIKDAGVAAFAVDTDRDGERSRSATATLCRAADAGAEEQPQRRDIAALLATHPQRTDGAALRRAFAERGVDYGPAFAGLVSACNAAGKSRTVVAEVELPRAVRSQQGGYGVHPALLDACFQTVLAHPAIKDAAHVGLLLPVSVARLRRYAPVRGTRYCQARIVSASESALQVDLDLLDETGAVVLAVEGLRMTAGGGAADQLMTERLLTVEWQRQTLQPVPERPVGSWLLITPAESDLLGSRLADALKSLAAQPCTLIWPRQADHAAKTAELSAVVRGGLDGVVIVCPPPGGPPDEPGLLAGREQVRHLVRMIRELPEMSAEPPRLYVLTRRAQLVRGDDDPNLVQAGLRGLLRVVGAENPQLRTTQIDLAAEDDIELVAQELLSGTPEDETAWRGGQWYTARLRCTPLAADERRTTTVRHETEQLRAVVRHPGDLQTLEFVALDRTAPRAGEVEIAVDAASVNFAEVIAALGRYPDLEGRPHQLGFDVGGVVARVGDGVTGLHVGDRVGGFAGFGNGSWGTFVTCDARLVVGLPAAVTTVQAAAAATAYGTAWYGLCELARICAEDKVLIHSGTGGVGQAAIAIARRAGADVFATAGSPERRELLQRMGIEHVYDSRSTAFAEQIRRDTDGYGVDIVLNSLTGAAQQAGIELLAYGGRFVEIGKRDIYADARLGLFPFRRNLSFYAVDLALLTHTHPGRVQQLLRTLYQRIADGELPVPTCTEYPLSEAATAIRVMSGAEHTGKLVLTVPRAGRTDAVLLPERAPVFRNDGAYIVTGGLGGLGLFLAGQMASRNGKAGCGRIVLTARSAPTPKARQAIERLRANGTDVVVHSGNIAEPETAAAVVAAATATGLPLRGVLHAAAVVEDAVLANITDELIDKDWAPKVNGVWNLHHATAGQPLDWFCSFSSVAALFGSAGQGAYAAASSWLDAFTRWRRSQGLPATAIAWGAWGEIGRATFLAAGGRTTMIAPDEGARAFETLLRYDRTYTGYVPTTGAPWLAALVARSPFAEAFRDSGDQHGAESSALRDELRALAPDEWPARLRRLIADQTGLILRRAIDPDRPFAEHGLDSLGNLELRTRIEAETGIRLTPKTIATYNSARALGAHLSEALAAEEAHLAAPG
ncbi:sulfolipid-1 biosynthesis phthioceranic/hydroxyphthioceranic acid synthase [Mycobacterium sherrisii]|uniref:sulfolipid-1 biosynthesis phthioceranic/hydroxyphthioceranic acid synthase n=1 Tax=Mycobacterium sherrisii TaxID=243061 RepID=UPI000A15DB2F|nr:type I polyketide synthase [Mycobacterium sherrisii]MCV7028980.1 type I polyketide synthase [Mycobacterium sherrisii]ORW75758.1 polyketide synthase [Mycobacterium sherrisii]